MCGRGADYSSAQRRRSQARIQVESDFNPTSISCGCRVSCAKALLVDGVSRQTGSGLGAGTAGNERLEGA
mgnify:CR=1 FL=1